MTAIFHYRTVITPQVLPPKPARELPRPAMSFADDAALCNARLNASWSRNTWLTKGDDAKALTREIESRIMEIIRAASTGLTTAEISAALGDVPARAVSRAMRRIEARGHVSSIMARQHVLVWSAI